MKFGVREICDVVFKATDTVKLGNTTFLAGQPVLYIDTAKTSSLAGAATTVYATGGRGNTRLLAWEGEKTLTFTVEDAMLSPLGFSVLTGAGLVEAGVEKDDQINVHTTVEVAVAADGDVVSLSAEKLGLATGKTARIFYDSSVDPLVDKAPIYGTVVDASGATVRSLGAAVKRTSATSLVPATGTLGITFTDANLTAGDRVVLDFYLIRTGNVEELSISADKFAGYYYVEASTLFRDQETGMDMPAEIVLPKVKIQSNFTFAMAATGDPSAFSFVMDAFPAPTKFTTKKVLCSIQIVSGDDTTVAS